MMVNQIGCQITSFIVYIVIFSVIHLGFCASNVQQVRHNQRFKRRVSSVQAAVLKMRRCDPSAIPLMDSFDVNKFSGEWYELGKTTSGFLDPDDGKWKLTVNPVNNGYNFFFKGRSRNNECIRPVLGTMTPSKETPGELILKYQTFTTFVSERIRVLDTDYNTLAIVYTCIHVTKNGTCHPAGVLGSIWTRQDHVDIPVFNKAISVLDKACIDSHSVLIRTKFGEGSRCPAENLFTHEIHAVVPDICYQAVNEGSCSGSVLKYHYDIVKNSCEVFSYGGCGGNDNNFMSIHECEEKCLNFKRTTCEESSVCGLHCPPCCRVQDYGCVKCDCENITVDESMKCVLPTRCPFHCKSKEMYPGCYSCDCKDHFDDIPASTWPYNFTTKRKTVKTKKKLDEQVEKACLEVKDPGTCSNKEDRYYYNAQAERCKKFIYTGCGGNKNNFETLVSCVNTCEEKSLKVFKTNIVNKNPNGAADSVINYQSVIVFLSSFITVHFLLHDIGHQ